MATTSRTVTVILWTLQVVMAAQFMLAGGVKLAGAGPVVAMFDTIGLGQSFRYVTGAIEVGSAVLLLIPSLAVFGAILLACTMMGATIAHVTVLDSSPLPVIVLFLLVSSIAWLRRAQLTRAG